MNQKPLFLAVTVTALLVIGGVFWMMQKRQVAMNQPVATDPVVETPVQTEPENPIDTSDWKTYRNEEYGFQMKYPKNFYVSENNEWHQPSPFFQAVFINSTISSGEFQVKVTLRNSFSEPVNIHLDQEPAYKETLDSITAYVFILEKYCDGPTCSGELVAVKAESGKYIYTIEFQREKDLKENVQNSILSTFHFLRQ